MSSAAGNSIEQAPEDTLLNHYGSAIVEVEARTPIVLITSCLGSARTAQIRGLGLTTRYLCRGFSILFRNPPWGRPLVLHSADCQGNNSTWRSCDRLRSS